MSEFLPYLRADNPEDEPAIIFHDNNGEQLPGTRENTRLYTFFGRAAFNHIFLTTDVVDGVDYGHYIWAVTPDNEVNPQFDNAMTYMFDNDYTCVLNRLEVGGGDVREREKYLAKAAFKAMEIEADNLDTSDELFVPDWL